MKFGKFAETERDVDVEENTPAEIRLCLPSCTL